MLVDFEINHYKGIEHLELPALGQFNLIGGRNNVGKTSILEAIFLYFGGSNPELTTKIGIFRNYFPYNDLFWKSYFKDLDYQANINIKGKWVDRTSRSHTRELQIFPYFGDENINIEKSIEQTATSGSSASNILETNIVGLKYKFNLQGPGSDYQGDIETTAAFDTEPIVKPSTVGRGLKFNISNLYQEKIYCYYMNHHTILNPEDMAARYDFVYRKKVLSDIIEVLNLLEPGLRDISLDSHKIYQCSLDKFQETMPINLLGSGINYLFSILLAVPRAENGMLLIDEIDAGLHYTTMSKLWDGIFRLARKFKVQIIATTHSMECIKAFYEASKEIEFDSMYFRIEKQDGKHRILDFDKLRLQNFLDEGLELT